MNTLIRNLVLAGVTALASVGATAGQAVVTFSHPETYTDFPDMDADRQELFKKFADHFIKMVDDWMRERFGVR